MIITKAFTDWPSWKSTYIHRNNTFLMFYYTNIVQSWDCMLQIYLRHSMHENYIVLSVNPSQAITNKLLHNANLVQLKTCVTMHALIISTSFDERCYRTSFYIREHTWYLYISLSYLRAFSNASPKIGLESTSSKNATKLTSKNGHPQLNPIKYPW